MCEWYSRGQRFDPAYLHQKPRSLAVLAILRGILFDENKYDVVKKFVVPN